MQVGQYEVHQPKLRCTVYSKFLFSKRGQYLAAGHIFIAISYTLPYDAIIHGIIPQNNKSASINKRHMKTS
jgi:hypothetical protein